MSNLNVQNLNGVNVQSLPSQTARAWVNFNGVGAVSIRKSFNIASLSDLGVGRYGILFTAPMPDNNYAVVSTVSLAGGAGRWPGKLAITAVGYTLTVTTLNAGADNPADADYCDCVVFD